MIIKNFELKKLDKIDYNLILLYGENEGFKQKIINDFFIKSFDGEIQKYEEEEIFINYKIHSEIIILASSHLFLALCSFIFMSAEYAISPFFQKLI